MKKQFINAIYAYLMTSAPVMAWAAPQTKLEQVLQRLVDWLTGMPARLMAVLAIVLIGYATLVTGRMQKAAGLSAIAGIGIIFGASSLVDYFIS